MVSSSHAVAGIAIECAVFGECVKLKARHERRLKWNTYIPSSPTFGVNFWNVRVLACEPPFSTQFSVKTSNSSILPFHFLMHPLPFASMLLSSVIDT